MIIIIGGAAGLMASIEKLTRLEHLDLSNNPITELPQELFNLPKLTFIKVDGLPLKNKAQVEAQLNKLTQANKIHNL